MSDAADRAAAGLLRLLIGALRALPTAVVRRLGDAVGELALRLDPRHPRVALRNLETALPDLAPAEHRAILRRCFRRQGSLMLDTLHLGRFSPEQLCRRLALVGWENFRRAEEAGRGVLLISGHLGIHELVVQAVPIYKGPVAVVFRPTGKPRLDRVLVDLHRRHGNRVIAKRGAVWGMLEALRGGGRAAILPDQRVHPNDGIEVPFFGRPSWTSPFPARVSQRTGAPALPIFGYQAPGGRYRLVARAPIFPGGEGEEETRRLATAYLAAIESEVRRAPAEWLWMHERWRRH